MPETFEDVQEALQTFSGVVNRVDSSWEPFIEILNNKEWTAFEFMNYVYMNTESRAMVPARLCSDKLIKLYEDKRDEWQGSYKWKFQWVIERVWERLSEGQSLEVIVNDEELHISSLAMYGITCSGDLSSSDRFMETALFERKCYPEVVKLFLSIFDRRCLP